ncbi:MAG: molecular chaperone DnaJ [Anaerolineae bacterium]|nr:molecular chaperone DnaJ [Anaerolineae bacterium]MCB0176882.1 molecular chaperone DnaJ [Anaerolineae bacterium]MCB0225257.1 molecular chaperone DnaJ [Anaerolineae bacterium]MCB9105043.1 molecular chaperone DnaJ [Anaerolineales bacterium]
MSNKRDYYEVLGVAKSASPEEIKKAYRRLARQYHPDVSEEADAETKFKEVNEAYEILSDEQKRGLYDRFGHAGVSGNAGGFGGGGFGFDVGRDPFEIFEEVFGSFGGFGGRRQTGRRPRRGSDLRYDLTLEFEEAIFGAEKEIEVPRRETCAHCNGSKAEPGTNPIRCPECNGTGEVRRQAGFFINISTCPRCQGAGEIITTPCNECQGRGQIVKKRRLSVKIPAGVDVGTQIRLSGEGESGVYGGPPGNLYVVIKVKEHAYFRRNDDTIHLELAINVTQAALGDEVEVPTLDGKQLMTIPAGTQTGETIRLRGQGVPRLRRDGSTSGRGDQVVTIQVRTPTNLSKEQRHLLLELGKTLDREVVPQREKSFFDRIRDAFGV